MPALDPILMDALSKLAGGLGAFLLALGVWLTKFTVRTEGGRLSVHPKRAIASEYFRQAQSTLAKKAAEYDRRLGDLERKQEDANKKLDEVLEAVKELKSAPWKMAPHSDNGHGPKKKPEGNP